MSQRIQHFLKLSTLCMLLLLTNITFTQTWIALGTGVNGPIYASIVFNGQLVVGGTFTSPGSNIARWNGTSWSTLGTGLNGVVRGLTVFNNQLIAVGSFNNVGNNVAAWNGTTWSPVGLGTNDTVYAAVVYNSTLRIGGKFTNAGGLVCNRLAGWNGSQWFQMPNGATNGANNTVYALAVFSSDLAIGGIFTMVGNNISANRVVRYNSSSGVYTPLSVGIDNNAVYALAVLSSQLYVGGSFTTIGGITVNRLARWTGTNWNSVSTGVNADVKAMYLNGSTLVIGGAFFTPGNGIIGWNGSVFSTYGNGLTGGAATVFAITNWSNVLVAGGSFNNAGLSPVPAVNVAGFGAAPVAPTLVSPPNGSNGVSINPALDWNNVTAASSYGVQVSTAPNFLNTVVNVTGLASSNYSVGINLINGVTYYWRANASNGIGTGPYSTVWSFTTGMVGIINTQEIPLEFNLYQNYPNPFNPVTKIRFDLPANPDNSHLRMVIYDASGSVVRELINTDYVAGKWELDFDGSSLASGVYFYKIEAGMYNAVNKMMIVK
jgi:Secretion system C-terminal sorting domain